MKHTFKGGIHPREGKHLSKDKPIREYLPKGDTVYPVSQHIGAPAKPVVKKGDEVLVGQLIAEAGGFVSANIHSSVSGRVKAVEKRLTASGAKVDSIIIENDGLFKSVDMIGNDKPVKELTREEVIDAVKAAGIVGMGGAGFPAHVKLSPKEPDKIDTVIVNASECEPYLTSDYRRILEQADEVIEGLRIVLAIFPGAKGIIAVEDNKPDAIELLKSRLAGDDDIRVNSLKTKYPEGAERQLIYANTGRYINSRMLPADAGCIVDNVETLVAIYNGVRFGRPLMNRTFTVTGDAVADPRNFSICIGTNFAELLEAADGLCTDAKKLIAGGPMMGFALFDLNIPTTKTTSALLCLSEDEASKYETTACINCGRCVEACPEQLVPSRLSDFAEHKQFELFEKWYGLECVECGSCSFGCPARRHLAQSIKSAKKLILASKRKK